MMFDRPRKYYEIAGVPSSFLATPDGIKVSIHTFLSV